MHLTIFGGLLCFILFINRPQSNKIFAWNEIRYKTTSATLPEARGICPGLEDNSKPVLVVARTEADGESKWLDVLADKYHLCVYTIDKPVDNKSTSLQVPANRGHEAIVYLTFLIDNYDHFPTAAVFIHGSRWAWHNDAPDYDNAFLLSSLNISAALKPGGYHNLRCDWSLTTCPPREPPQGSLETSMQAALDPWDTRAVSDAALPHALKSLFGGNEDSVHGGGVVSLGRDNAVRSQCCAQFVVSRDSLWQHSRAEYQAIRQWLLDGSRNSDANRNLQSNKKAAPRDDRVAGRILSYVWHILFLQREASAQGSTDRIDLERLNSLACPRADGCYCRLYGRCNLDHCGSPSSCQGQYRLPPNLKLPDDWAATHM